MKKEKPSKKLILVNGTLLTVLVFGSFLIFKGFEPRDLYISRERNVKSPVYIETEYQAESPLGRKGGVSLPASCASGVWNNNNGYHLVASFSDPGNCATNTGICGTANGIAVASAPSTNLCGVGTPSSVSGSGPFIWSCNGVGGGAPISCSAPLQTSYNCEAGNLNPGLSIISNHTVLGMALSNTMRWYTNIWGGTGVGGCFYNSSSNNYFVPTATQAERNAFQSNLPNGVTKGGF